MHVISTRASVAVRPTLLTPSFVAVGLAALAYFTGAGTLIPAVPRYVAGPLAAGNVSIGVVVGAFSLSAFFLRPWVGGVADRRGRRLLMLVGASLFAASVLGYAVAASPVALVGLRLLTGAGEAFFFVGASTAFADLAPPQRRGEAISVASLALYVGLGIGPVLGEVTLERFGFVAVWLLAALAALIALAMTLRVPDTRPVEVASTTGSAVRQRFLHPAGVLPGLVLLTNIWGMAGFLAFVPLYALDIGMDGARLVLLLFSGIVIGIRSLGASLPDRLGPARATRMALALSVAGLAIVAVWGTPPGLVLGTAIFAGGITLFTPAIFSLALEGVAAGERGAVIGTTSAFLDLALGLGPATLGLVAAAISRPATFLAGAAVASLGLFLVIGTRLGRPAESVQQAGGRSRT